MHENDVKCKIQFQVSRQFQVSSANNGSHSKLHILIFVDGYSQQIEILCNIM